MAPRARSTVASPCRVYLRLKGMAANRRASQVLPFDARVREGAVRLALSRRDAAAALGMSLRHFQRHVQPQLRCVYSGQLRLYPVTELQRWLAENASEAGRAA
jgi:hypothetical protein